MPALAESTLTYADYRRLRSPLPSFLAPSFTASPVSFLPLPSPPSQPFLPLFVAAHLSSSSLSFSCIRALVTLLRCESILLPSEEGGDVNFPSVSIIFFFTFLSLYLFLSFWSRERDPLRKSRNWTIVSPEIHQNHQCQCRSHGGYPAMVHWCIGQPSGSMFHQSIIGYINDKYMPGIYIQLIDISIYLYIRECAYDWIHGA